MDKMTNISLPLSPEQRIVVSKIQPGMQYSDLEEIIGGQVNILRMLTGKQRSEIAEQININPLERIRISCSLGLVREAEILYKKALSSDSFSHLVKAQAVLMLAETYWDGTPYSRGMNFEKFIEMYNELLDIRTTDKDIKRLKIEAKLKLANIYTCLLNYTDSNILYNSLLSPEGYNLEISLKDKIGILQGLIFNHYKQGNHDEVFRIHEEVINIDHNDEDILLLIIYNIIGYIKGYLVNNKIDEAILLYYDLMNINFDDKTQHIIQSSFGLEFGTKLLTLNKFTRAKEVFDLVLKIQSDNKDIQKNQLEIKEIVDKYCL